MKPDRWAYWLKRTGLHAKDPGKCERIIRGITHGVNIDFIGDRTVPRFGKNLPLGDESYEAKITAVIKADVDAGKKAGPYAMPPCEHFVVSPIGAVPKKGSTKIRVIHHLSFPFHGESINADILDEYLPLSSFHDAADAIRRLGPGCWLIKLDVEAAYKQVPVRREDWHLLGFKWLGDYYYERVLPFGLKSSCRLWDMFADALHHFLKHEFGIDVVLHYIDDFLFVCQTRAAADAALIGANGLCEDIGIPWSPAKTEGPTHCLTYLGIELDTVRQRARLPEPKLRELQTLAEVWLEKSHATGAELQSAVGSLSFACQVVRPGRFYLRRIIARMAEVVRETRSRSKQLFSLSEDVKEDFRWWARFIREWNGVSMLYEVEWTRTEKLTLFTDACLDGYGALFGLNWFAAKWTDAQKACAFRVDRESMPFYELYALVAAAATFGPAWKLKKVLFRCDCMPVVDAIRNQSSKQPAMMHLLRQLSEIACKFAFDFRCEHIPGKQNVAADILSRDGDCPQFRALCPWAVQAMSPIVPLLLPIPAGLWC